MATNRREIPLECPAASVRDAIRDFAQVHERVAPGFLVKGEVDGGDRIVTFFNGLVARERLVAVDEERNRLIYAVVDGQPTHYNAAVEVLGESPTNCRTIDLLPDGLGPVVAGMMDHALPFMKKGLESQRP
jgi:hypothetical protein